MGADSFSVGAKVNFYYAIYAGGYCHMGFRILFRAALALFAIGFGLYRLIDHGYSDGNFLQNGLPLILVGLIVLASALWHFRRWRRP